MSLTSVANGQTVAIDQIHLEPERQKRLWALGLVPGTPVQMINRALFGGTLVACRGNKIVLGLDLARQISVRF